MRKYAHTPCTCKGVLNAMYDGHDGRVNHSLTKLIFSVCLVRARHNARYWELDSPCLHGTYILMVSEESKIYF